MANFKKKNGNRKRARLNGFRNIKIDQAVGLHWRHGGLIRRFARQSLKAASE